jgi:uncharacterized protein DUF3450
MMMYYKAKKTNLILAAIVIMLLALSASGFSQSPQKPNSVSKQAVQYVENAIQIQQKTQKDRTQWEQEKAELVLQFEQLIQQKKILKNEKKSFLVLQTNQEMLNQTLEQQKKESIRIQKELVPFLNVTYSRLETLVDNDPPFLKKERNNRLTTLLKILDDPEITIAEKYRKVFEAVFIEAEYGTTIEVYQDKIKLESNAEETLGNIFRLGRVSLFFLSLDQSVCGVYDPGQNTWQILPEHLLPSIRSAADIANKRKPVELLPLPIGRLASGGNNQ